MDVEEEKAARDCRRGIETMHRLWGEEIAEKR